MGPCQQGVLKWHSIWSSCQPCQRNCQISTGTVIKISRASYLKDPPPFVFRTPKSLFQSFPQNVCSTRIASWQTGDQLFMLLMMLGVGRRRWTTRQNILHQANTMKYYALLTRPCLKVLFSSADNRGDSRSKEIHGRLGQVLLSTISAINPPLFLNIFYRIDPIISIRVVFFHY